MFTGKTVLALALSALLPASAAWAANKDTIIYCSEASPESFNQLWPLVCCQLANAV